MKANYKDKLKKTTEISGSSLYEMNQIIMQSEPLMSKEDTLKSIEKLAIWIYDKSNTEKYFMMLCKDLSDYTVFNIDKENTGNAVAHHCNTMAVDVIDCIKNRGDLISIEETEDKNAWEIWIKIMDKTYAFYLFPYTSAVIEY